jgi:hypothetical protein
VWVTNRIDEDIRPDNTPFPTTEVAEYSAVNIVLLAIPSPIMTGSAVTIPALQGAGKPALALARPGL